MLSALFAWSLQRPCAPALTALFALMVVTGCGHKKAEQKSDTPLSVATLKVAAKPVPLTVESVGRTEGSREVEVRARVSGILEQQTYIEGTTVKRASTLFIIDPAPYEIALSHARAALAEQQAAIQQAQRNADRLGGLAKQNAVSRRVGDDALSALDAAKAGLLAAQANVREAELNLSYTRVTASIGGIAGRSVHSEGSLVTAAADSSLLTTVTQTDPLWVRFAVSDAEYQSLREAGAGTAADQATDPAKSASGKSDQVNGAPNQPLGVALLRKNGEPYPTQGRINFTGSQIDAQLGTLQLRAEFPNPAMNILPGEYLRVRLTGGAQQSIVLPQTAVLQNQQGPFVWIVNDKQQAEQRVVQTGVWLGSDWQILSGLTQGDVVIVDNLQKLKQGQAVKARDAQPQQPASADASVARPNAG